MIEVVYLFLIFILMLGVLTAGWTGLMGFDQRGPLVKRAQKARDHFIGKPEEAAALTLKRDDEKSKLDALVSHFLPNTEHWRKMIGRTGTNLTLGKLAIFAVIFALVVGLGLWEIGVSLVIALPAAIGGGFWMPRFIVNYLVNRRVTKFISVFPDAVGLMVRGLRAGLPVTETIIGVTREIGEPVGTEFRRIADHIQLGKPLEDALWETAERIDMPEFTFMAIAFSIQRETGGNLAETLDNLDQILRRRRQLHLKVKTYSAEAKASATIIGALPFVVASILAAVDFDYIQILFTTETGHVFLSAAILCLVIGVGTMIKMGRFEI
jgi:tight adherence protein B